MDARRQKRLGPAPIASFEKSFEDNTTTTTPAATTGATATPAAAQQQPAEQQQQQQQRVTVSTMCVYVHVLSIYYLRIEA